MFVMGCYGHKLSNGVLFAHHLILDVPGGSSHLGYRRRVPPGHNPHTRVKIVILIPAPRPTAPSQVMCLAPAICLCSWLGGWEEQAESL